MEIRSIFYNTFSNKEFFELTEGRRKWDIFIIISIYYLFEFAKVLKSFVLV